MIIKKENMYKIFPPLKRTVNAFGEDYFLPFPRMIFWKKADLYCAFLKNENEICLPLLGNINYDFKVCLNYYSSNLNELIERFWQSKFTLNYEGFYRLIDHFDYDKLVQYPGSKLTNALQLWQDQGLKNLDIVPKAKLVLKTLELYDYETDSPSEAYSYCLLINKRLDSSEKTIINSGSSAYVYCYARDVIKGRWLEGEEIIKRDINYAYCYAKEVVKSRCLELEDVIRDSWYYWENYKRYFKIK